MKYILQILIALLLICNTAYPQVSISVKLKPTNKTTEIILINFEGIHIHVKKNANNEFIYSSNTLQQGFYELDPIGKIYLTNGYNLKVKPTKINDFIFEGKGATENNVLRVSKKTLGKYLPLDNNNPYGGLTEDILNLEPRFFLLKIDSFKNYFKIFFEKSKDTFFKKYAALDLYFYCNSFLFSYFSYYGMDLKILDQMKDLYIDPNLKPNDIAHKMMVLLSKAHKKKMDSKDRETIRELLANWNKADETLFKNSKDYREAFNNYFALVGNSYKYHAISYKNPEDKYIKNLTIANDTITNPYILNYFKYTYTKDIINTTKDIAIANKYYQQFVRNNTRQDFLQTINEVFNNRLIYTDGMAAPTFIYKDISGKPIALQNLTGTYVYLDVWATWCGPCKVEIPYLQKLEEEYKNKKIQFVSISVDEQKDKSKWKDYIRKNKLGGLQVLADSAFESSFIKKMNINSIPRFILIDPDGKLIATDADRPSSKEIKLLLDKLLL